MSIKRRARNRLRRHLPAILGLSAIFAVSGPADCLVYYICDPGSGDHCICISWTYADQTYSKEWRCPNSNSGWVNDGPPDPPIPPPPSPNDGSYGGGGGMQNPSSPHPGGSLVGRDPLESRVTAAKSDAQGRLKRWKALDGSTTKETTCSALFFGNKLGLPGRTILGSAIFRYGQNYSVNGVFPCTQIPGTYLFFDLTRGHHNPYVFVCDGFAQFAGESAGTMVIHEILHMSGQLEDPDGSLGPGDPPNSNQIQQTVEAACYDPIQPLP
jgi:hypothetical protein